MENEVIEKSHSDMTNLEIINFYFKKEKIQKLYESKQGYYND